MLPGSSVGAWAGWNLNTWSPRGGVNASTSTEKVKGTTVTVGPEQAGIQAESVPLTFYLV